MSATYRLPGARWVRAALQVNPYEYKGKNQPSTSFSSEADYNEALLDQCDVLGIGLIAITDHWCVDTAQGLVVAAGARGIIALPGFEANSSEGVHILVIFEAGTDFSVVNAAIGACDAQPGCNNGTTGKPFKDILSTMSNRGALVIPAHANVPNSGMLTGRSGPPLVAMVKDRNLHAIAITPSQTAGTDQAEIVSNTKPYDRKHPLAIVYADDIVHPNQLKLQGSTTWFKMSSPCMESLKLAVRTPETRVAKDDPNGAPRALLKQISWEGGFLDGVRLPISSDLTALIGGRGTGKSTVIESLRYALGLSPLGAEAIKDHKDVVSKVLRSGTIVKVDVEVVLPSPRRYTIERTVPDPPIVRDAAGEITNQKPVDIAGDVEVFGQHELAELASKPESVAAMLRRFAGSDGNEDDFADVLGKLTENRAQLERVETARSELKDQLADIPRLEEQAQQFKETDVAKRLADLHQLGRDEAVFAEATQRIESASSAVAEMADEQLSSMLEAEFEGIEDSSQTEFLELVIVTSGGLAAKLKELGRQASEAVAAAESKVASAKLAWEGAVQKQREVHAEVLRKLHEEGLEPDKYLDTTKALGALRAKQPRLAGYDKNLESLQKDRDDLLKALAEIEHEQLEALHQAVRDANSATGGVVIVRPIAAPDRSHIMDAIGHHISGARTQIAAAVAAEDFSPRSLAAAIRGGASELEKLVIRGAQAANLIGAGEALARELEEMTVGHAVEVLLDISTENKTRELKLMSSLSKGQRATALLLLLLGASTAPLVIDQPEDDLDNRFVYDGVVMNLRKLKGVRQVIASTHNANVPVLGDAELIIALEGDGQAGRPAPGGIGSLDDRTIRDLAERILEGGPAAFNARHHLYGF